MKGKVVIKLSKGRREENNEQNARNAGEEPKVPGIITLKSKKSNSIHSNQRQPS
jgi:hypothetical protein